MKTLFAIAIFILCLNQASQAQNDSIVLNKFYHTWIIPVYWEKGTSGILYEIKDSSVMVSSSPWKNNYVNNKFDVVEMDIRNIQEIKVRRQGGGFAVLVGGVSGAIVGAIISAAYTVQLTQSMRLSKFATGGFLQGTLPFVLSTGIGLGVGALLSAKIKIPIGGSQDQYETNKLKLNNYALKSNSFTGYPTGKAFSKFRDTVVDIDGNVYKTIVLGRQVWMGENLRVARYRDGSKISGYTSNHDTSEIRYPWPVVDDERKLCPSGWHVPSLTEWTSLFNSVGGEGFAGGRLEESFNANKPIGHWWSSTIMDTDRAQSFYLNNKTNTVIFTGKPKNSGLSVRCIRDN